MILEFPFNIQFYAPQNLLCCLSREKTSSCCSYQKLGALNIFHFLTFTIKLIKSYHILFFFLPLTSFRSENLHNITSERQHFSIIYEGISIIISGKLLECKINIDTPMVPWSTQQWKQTSRDEEKQRNSIFDRKEQAESHSYFLLNLLIYPGQNYLWA